MPKRRKPPTIGTRSSDATAFDSLRRNLAVTKALCGDLTTARKNIRGLIDQITGKSQKQRDRKYDEHGTKCG
jgi:hypothetical protein